jgi:predicted ribosomally synthesized peptide with SipW-like signal peptide
MTLSIQRILLSLGMIAFVAALAVGGTGAFFSDTETSTGNTFAAGAINLTVDSQQHYNNAICVLNTDTTDPTDDYYWQLEPQAVASADQYPVIGSPCTGTWAATDLGAQKFFNFLDIKPGDSGENTVSLHIDNNPAWACVNIKTTANDENTLIEPELTAGDIVGGPIGFGELAGNLKFQTWLDQGAIPGFGGEDTGEGDNIWQAGEPSLAAGALSDIVGNGLTLTLADGGTGTPLPPTVTNYIGMFWCAGTITGGAGTLGCNGTSMGNTVQTDSATVDVEFRVEQARNNGSFRCIPPPPPPQT